MNIALKEWAVVLEALALGHQRFLLRKGGLGEGGRGFQLRHNEFLFFPTWEHQQADAIQPAYRGLFEKLQPQDPDAVEIRYLAKVTDVLRAPPSIDGMQRLAHCHIWAEPYLRMRYEYRPDLPLLVLLTRMYRLPQSTSIPNDRRYAGCRSWVTLYKDVPVEEVQAISADGECQSTREALLKDLRHAGAAAEPLQRGAAPQ